SGQPLREFLYVDDLAAACLFLMENYDGKLFVNIGTGTDLSIKNLAELIKEVIGFEGSIDFDATKPDGTPRKLMDVTRLSEMGWQSTISLKEGLKKTYQFFKDEVKN